MRRVFKILVLSAMVQAVVPAPARAELSWYWLADLSGPGKFTGQYFEYRLVCFFRLKVKRYSSVEFHARYGKCRPVGPCQKPPQKRSGELDPPVVSKRTRSVERPSISSFATLHTDANNKYADGKPIKLTMLEPSFSWACFLRIPPIQVDAGTGGGVYWFSSEGFESFSGVVLEPVRFDVHVGSSSVMKTPWWWIRIPMFTAGWAIFPRGFDANAFATTGDGAKRLPAELRFAWGFWFDLDPVLERIRGN